MKKTKKRIFVYNRLQQVYNNLPSLTELTRNFATEVRSL